MEADVIGRAELLKRRAELLQASTEVAALRTQLRGLGMTDGALRELASSPEPGDAVNQAAFMAGRALAFAGGALVALAILVSALGAASVVNFGGQRV